MNIQEFREFFVNSDYSDETKAILADILKDKTEVTPGLIFEVKDVLQKEIDNDFKELGVDLEGNEEAEKAQKEYHDALDQIEKELSEDMGIVENELKELDEVRKTISKIVDEKETEKIKQSI